MRILTMVLLAAALTACNRKVEVNSAPAPASGMAVHLTNNANQAVNAYVTSSGSDVFIGQVAANSEKTLHGVGRLVGNIGHAQGAHGGWRAHVHEGQRVAHVEHGLDRPLMHVRAGCSA